MLFNASSPPGETNPACKFAQQNYGKKVCVMYDLLGVNTAIDHYRKDFEKMNADQVIQSWRPMGVLKTEAAPNRTRLGDVKSLSRLVNLVVGHRVKMFNIWGGDIDVGTRLYVICKKVLYAELAGASHQRSVKHSSDGTVKGMRWYLYTYADKNHRVPPLSELQYQENGEKKLGAYMCIGFSSEKTKPYGLSQSSSRELSASLQNHMGMNDHNFRLLNQMEVYFCN